MTGDIDTTADDPYPSSRTTTCAAPAPAAEAAPPLSPPSARPAPRGLAATFRSRYFPDVSDSDWDDWKWQYRNRITTLAELEKHFPLNDAARHAVREVMHEFRLGITPYYLSLIDPDDPEDPIRRQAVPTVEEFLNLRVGEDDPLGEEQYSPVPGITHRYPDRCLMVVTNACALYCRYCTRKRIMEEGEAPPPKATIDRMIDYIAQTPAIRDVVVSGGDPLTFSTQRLEEIISRLRAIPHLEIIRIGSRLPVTMPQRITPELCAMLERYGPIWCNTHFNHPREVTAEAARACDRLLRAGIPVNNQAVLLRGVNDSLETIKALVHALMRIKVRPYYLYHCDPIKGAHHFRTTVAKGLEIMEGLRGHTSGLAVPQYVIDAPGGGGKVPIMPQYLLAYQNGRAIIRNFQGRIFEYDDAVYEEPSPPKPAPKLFFQAQKTAERPRWDFAARPANGNGNGNGSGNGNGNGNGKLPVLTVLPKNGNGNGNGGGPGCGAH